MTTGENLPTASKRSRRLGLAAIACLVLAAATVIQSNGWNQSSHYALVKSMAAGTPVIDPYLRWTGDRARFEGHWYSSRAPGLALLAVPAYAALGSPGAPYRLSPPVGRLRFEKRHIWALALWAALLPAALILVLVRRLGDALEPRLGAAAAVALGAGTLLLPFSTMLFSHVLSAALGLAAFALLWREREGPPRAWPLAAAGALVGLAVTTEYPLAIAGLVLGLYAVSRRDEEATLDRRIALALTVVRRGLAYSAGVLAGVLPLLAYNVWAFGSPTHLAYADLEDHDAGFFGIGLPDPSVAAELLLSSRGLLTLAPILVLALVGLPLLHRRGKRAEAWAVGAIALAYLLYNAGYWLPYGGEVPGPRFLISALPFLGVPLVLAFRRLPGPAIALALASTVTLATTTIAGPLIENDAEAGTWAPALAAGDLEETVFSGLADGWLAGAPFVALVAAALALAAAAAGPERLGLSVRQAGLGAAAVVGWALVAIFVPTTLGIDASAGARIVAAGGSATPATDHGPLPLRELALLALVVALAGLALASLLPRLSARGRGLPRGERRTGSAVSAPATRA